MAELKKLAPGDTITIKSGAYNISPYNDGKPNGKFASFVYNMEFTVMQVGLGSDKGGKITNYVAFGIPGKGYTGAIAVEDIKSVNYKTPAGAETKPKDTKPKNTKPATTKADTTNTADDTSAQDAADEASRNSRFTNSESYVTYNGVAHTGTTKKGFKSNSADQQVVVPKDSVTPMTIETVKSIIKTGKLNGHRVESLNRELTRQSYYGDKEFQFPKLIRGTRNFDYTIDLNEFWDDSKGDPDKNPLSIIEGYHQIPRSLRKEAFNQKVENYFRFKLPNPNTGLSKGFAHVFFTRPDLNVLYNKGNGTFGIPIACEDDSSIYYAFRNNIDILRELVSDNGMEHDFMFLLSNAARSFSLLDEKIKTDEWSKTWTGHTVTYGKHSNDSKSASTFNIEYIDDRNLSIYHLHKLWIDYIDKVYRGQIIPRGLTKQKNGTWAPAHGASSKGNGAAFSFTADKVLDYACSVYYILTAEDGESIIFWSKYYGVFPTVAPSSPFSYTYGDVVTNPKLDIEYAYSFKQDYNPFNLAEFNWLYRKPNKETSKYSYVSSYNPIVFGAGPSRVGAPFIETVINENSSEPYQFKLRFRPVPDPSNGSASTYYKSVKGMNT